MIVAIIGVLAGGLGLISILDSITPGDLTGWFLDKIWGVLQFLIMPLFRLFELIWSSICGIVKDIFF